VTNDFSQAIKEYAEKFGETPTVLMIPPSRQRAAITALRDAVVNGSPLPDDEFMAAIGMIPLSSEDLI
jgi:hypothetical protein